LRKLPTEVKLVKSGKDALELGVAIANEKKLASKPSSTLPVEIMCQGLDW